jgi:hypothetical protein
LKLLNLKKTKLHLHSIIAKRYFKRYQLTIETLIINNFDNKIYPLKKEGAKIKLEVKKKYFDK